MAENKDLKTKIFLNLNLLLCVILAITLFFYWFKISPFQDQTLLIIISILATSTVFFSGIRSIKERRVSIDLLASIALLVSLVEKEWVSAVFINLMIASARTFISYVKIRSHSAIDSLLKLKPTKVKITEDGRIIEIPIEKVKKGDRVVVELGGRIPVDGLIEKGEAMIDQSSLTGESLPIFKKTGDRVLSFTTVVSGQLVVLAEKVGEETTFEKIIALVEQAQINKAPIYTLIDRFAKWYIILTIIGSFVVYLLSRDVTLVLGLLLVSCADDIAIATPLALMTAITHSAKKHGAVIKGGDFLEALSKLKVIVFDKTGTLTRGKLKVEEIFSFGDKKEKELLELAAMASSLSTHPISQAIVNYVKGENISIAEPEKFEEYGGKGMVVFYKNKRIVIGKLSFLKELKIKITQEQVAKIENDISNGLNITLIGQEEELIGYISMLDELRPKIKETIQKLKELAVKKTVMLTGDNEKIAQQIAIKIGIDEFHANLLPADKLKYLKKYLSKKYKVAMVGDGVNDAPVLALADVGIAMGAIGSDAAIQAADIAMMKDDLSQIPELIKIGKSTIRVVRQNLLLWGGLNVLGLTLVFLHILNPSGAAAYNFATDFIPILNSLRLFR